MKALLVLLLALLIGLAMFACYMIINSFIIILIHITNSIVNKQIPQLDLLTIYIWVMALILSIAGCVLVIKYL